MKKLILIVILSTSLVLSGCGDKSDVQQLDPKQKDVIEIDTLGYKGEFKYEITDAYITKSPVKDNINTENIDVYSTIMYEDTNGEIKEAHREEFLSDDGNLEKESVMYVLNVRVTNVNAEYKHYIEDGFDTPYIFRADNLFMNFIDENGNLIFGKNIDYYSNRQEEETHWSTFKLEPGETVEYQIGFVVGSIYREEGKTYNLDTYNPYISSVQGGLEQNTKQYLIEWEERR